MKQDFNWIVLYYLQKKLFSSNCYVRHSVIKIEKLHKMVQPLTFNKWLTPTLALPLNIQWHFEDMMIMNTLRVPCYCLTLFALEWEILLKSKSLKSKSLKFESAASEYGMDWSGKCRIFDKYLSNIQQPQLILNINNLKYFIITFY